MSFSLGDRYTSRTRQQRFVNVLLPDTQGYGRPLAITFTGSAMEQAIQATDFIAWSFFRKYEFGTGRQLLRHPERQNYG